MTGIFSDKVNATNPAQGRIQEFDVAPGRHPVQHHGRDIGHRCYPPWCWTDHACNSTMLLLWHCDKMSSEQKGPWLLAVYRG